MISNYLKWTLIFIASVTIGTSCTDLDTRCQDCLVQHGLSDPQKLTPLNTSDNSATIIFQYMFQTLVHLDFKTNELIPVLLKERPVFETQEDGKVTTTVEIRPEATWDDGTPITAQDVIFTLKVLKCPKTDSKHLKPYFEAIEDVIVDPKNPKKFTLVYTYAYFLAESSFTDLYILPQPVYDPDNILKDYTIKELTLNTKKYEEDTEMVKFGNQYGASKFQREVVVGSGPYRLDEWETDQRINLSLKEDWWGHSIKDANHWFEAHPKKITIEVVNDLTTAVTALKGERLDIMNGIPNKQFVEELTSEGSNFLKKFNTFTPPTFAYDYIGMNMRLDKFKDVNTRKGLAHLMNIDQFIETYFHGLGEQVSCFTHPSMTKRINKDIVPYTYDLEKAKAYLKKAGWEDSDGNGILDKTIDGEKQDFTITLNTNQGNARRETGCLIFQEMAKKAGVQVEIVAVEWGKLLDNLRRHDFEMYLSGWVSSPLESDSKQIWHTESAAEGSNYVNFGNAESDALIEAIQKEIDEDKRAELYKKLHMIIHENAPYIFLTAQKERIAIAKKFNNGYGSGIRPGFWAPGMIAAQPVAN